ncbi:hypothetical protein NE236_10060 [Actinoallomurus purpureus]|uniref:hypothetical protein n=1 Tax=Actinoallomurus purpureus TaxID=478114 RepID=UPI002093E349|nr:hypothetical protein [Actinoallomurus purpureus]MCO6005328.1 hypothetical protein [Actinoallomurus purpureus]
MVDVFLHVWTGECPFDGSTGFREAMSVQDGAQVKAEEAMWLTSRHSGEAPGAACVQASAGTLSDGVFTLDRPRPRGQSGQPRSASTASPAPASLAKADQEALAAFVTWAGKRTADDPAQKPVGEAIKILDGVGLPPGLNSPRDWTLESWKKAPHAWQAVAVIAEHLRNGGNREEARTIASRLSVGHPKRGILRGGASPGGSLPQANDASTSQLNAPEYVLRQGEMSRRRRRPNPNAPSPATIQEDEASSARPTPPAVPESAQASGRRAGNTTDVGPTSSVEPGHPTAFRYSPGRRRGRNFFGSTTTNYELEVAKGKGWWNDDKFNKLLEELGDISADELVGYSLRFDRIPDNITTLAAEWKLNATFLYRLSATLKVAPEHFSAVRTFLGSTYHAYSQAESASARSQIAETVASTISGALRDQASNILGGSDSGSYSVRHLMLIAHHAKIDINIATDSDRRDQWHLTVNASNLMRFIGEYVANDPSDNPSVSNLTTMRPEEIETAANAWRNRIATNAANELLDAAFGSIAPRQPISASAVKRVAETILTNGEVYGETSAIQKGRERAEREARKAEREAKKKRNEAKTVWREIVATSLLENLRDQRQGGARPNDANIPRDMVKSLAKVMWMPEHLAAIERESDPVKAVISSPDLNMVLATAESLVDQLLPQGRGSQPGPTQHRAAHPHPRQTREPAGSQPRTAPDTKEPVDRAWLEYNVELLLEHLRDERKRDAGLGDAQITREMVARLNEVVQGPEYFPLLRDKASIVEAVTAPDASDELQFVSAIAKSLVDELFPQGRGSRSRPLPTPPGQATASRPLPTPPAPATHSANVELGNDGLLYTKSSVSLSDHCVSVAVIQRWPR